MLKIWAVWPSRLPFATPMLGPISRFLKSTLRRSQGRTVCMSVYEGGLKKESLTSAHVL